MRLEYNKVIIVQTQDWFDLLTNHICPRSYMTSVGLYMTRMYIQMYFNAKPVSVCVVGQCVKVLFTFSCLLPLSSSLCVFIIKAFSSIGPTHTWPMWSRPSAIPLFAFRHPISMANCTWWHLTAQPPQCSRHLWASLGLSDDSPQSLKGSQQTARQRFLFDRHWGLWNMTGKGRTIVVLVVGYVWRVCRGSIRLKKKKGGSFSSYDLIHWTVFFTLRVEVGIQKVQVVH